MPLTTAPLLGAGTLADGDGMEAPPLRIRCSAAISSLCAQVAHGVSPAARFCAAASPGVNLMVRTTDFLFAGLRGLGPVRAERRRGERGNFFMNVFQARRGYSSQAPSQQAPTVRWSPSAIITCTLFRRSARRLRRAHDELLRAPTSIELRPAAISRRRIGPSSASISVASRSPLSVSASYSLKSFFELVVMPEPIR